MESTDEPLKPITPPVFSTGDPSGHHEITEPNLTATGPCRGCSPVIEISVSGFDTTPAADQAGSSVSTPPAQATVTAGDSEVIVSQAPGGSGIVVGGTKTITPGQTVTISNTPIAIETSGGKTQIVIGTASIPLTPNSPESAQSQITEAPIKLSPIVVGDKTITANAQSQYVIDSRTTLVPGGHAITVSGTTLSLLPSATAVVVNGQTSNVVNVFGVYTTTLAPLLTWNSRVFTPNVAGYYRLGTGTTLIPGGPAVTASGTVISLDYGGTAAVISGSTSFMTPTTTILTWTIPTGPASSVPPTGGSFAHSTAKHSSAGITARGVSVMGIDGVLQGFFLLAVLGVGWLAVWL